LTQMAWFTYWLFVTFDRGFLPLVFSFFYDIYWSKKLIPPGLVPYTNEKLEATYKRIKVHKTRKMAPYQGLL
jgi:hypothetical protein